MNKKIGYVLECSRPANCFLCVETYIQLIFLSISMQSRENFGFAEVGIQLFTLSSITRDKKI